MDISADVDAIVTQAADWNFAGDCAILELMKRISQNLNERGERTGNLLKDFDTQVKRTEIALDNATNSLRSLQFGQQFVEYRVEDVDDEDFAMLEEQQQKPAPPMKSSVEMRKEFVENNLQMFRKNFEPVTIEVPDSDDEEAASNTTTIFRALNPYDAVPLPYIIGSKAWTEHKYAGLHDSAENSEDERSEQFSSSSSDNEREDKKSSPEPRYEAPQLSDSSSLASLPKELAIAPPTRAVLPTPIPPAGQAEARPKTQPRQIISSSRNPHEHDLFAALRQSPPSDDPPSTTSSSPSTSSPAIAKRAAQQSSAGLPANSSLSSSSSSASRPNLGGRQSPLKLFDEEAKATPTATPLAAPAAPTQSQIKRKPVNLFNDDEFNSFMSEIVDKTQEKASSSSNSQSTESPKAKQATPRVVEQPKPKEAVKAVAVPEPRKTVNLFDDSPPLSPQATIPRQPAAAPEKPPKLSTKVNSLFDDDLDGDDFLSAFASKPKKPLEQKLKTSLFEDDDDLDIDDIFVKKTEPKVKPTGRISLFDDDDDKDDAVDIFGTKKLVESKKKETEKEQQKQLQKKPEKELQKEIPAKPFDAADIFGAKKTMETKPKKPEKELQKKPEKELQKENPSKPFDAVDIFGAKKREPEKELDKDLQKEPEMESRKEKKPEKELQKEKQPEKEPQKENSAKPLETKAKVEPSLLKKSSLFDDIAEDEDLFGVAQASKKIVANNAGNGNEVKSNINKSPEKEIKDKKKTSSGKVYNTEIGDNELAGSKKEKPINKAKAEASPAQVYKPEGVGDFVDDFKTSEKENLNTQKEAIMEINIPTDNKNTPEEIEETLAQSSTPLISSESTNKIQTKELVEQSNELELNRKEELFQKVDEQDDILDELFKDLKVSQEPANDEAATFSDNETFQEQDPIITMVADNVGGNQKSSNNNPTDLAAAQQLLQNYSSLFSDEPPDDSEFFQTLGSSSLSSLSASKIFDSEQDFFEPTLPNLPAGANNLEEAAASKDYGGLHLFSDVPPDDNEEEEEQEQVEEEAAAVTPTAKRIHTIFYDDFSETARAKESTQKQSLKLSLFDDEPPPDLSSIAAKDVVDRSAETQVEALVVASPSSPVKKLKMPNININVQALLPGAGARPKLRQTTAATQEEAIKPVTAPQAAAHTPQAVASSNSDQLLQNVTKSRVRGPAHRRPSTRRARQQSYEKSLLADEQSKVEGTNVVQVEVKAAPVASKLIHDSDDDEALFKPAARKLPEPEPSKVLSPSKPAPKKLPEPEHNKVLSPSKPAISKPALVKPIEVKPKSKLFLDSDDDAGDDLFAKVPAKVSVKVSAKVSSKTSSKTASLFSSDEDELASNADFLSALKPQPKVLAKPKLSTKSSLFSDDEDDDDLFARPAARPAQPRKSVKVLPTPIKTLAATSADNPLADLLDP